MSTPLQDALEDLHNRLSALDAGAVATYIPELGNADPDHFAICIATVDGHLYSVGDAEVPFTIQSISKPFVYGLALDDLGADAVLEKVGVEPSGEAFNAISLESARPRKTRTSQTSRPDLPGQHLTRGIVDGRRARSLSSYRSRHSTMIDHCAIAPHRAHCLAARVTNDSPPVSLCRSQEKSRRRHGQQNRQHPDPEG